MNNKRLYRFVKELMTDLTLLSPTIVGFFCQAPITGMFGTLFLVGLWFFLIKRDSIFPLFLWAMVFIFVPSFMVLVLTLKYYGEDKFCDFSRDVAKQEMIALSKNIEAFHQDARDFERHFKENKVSVAYYDGVSRRRMKNDYLGKLYVGMISDLTAGSWGGKLALNSISDMVLSDRVVLLYPTELTLERSQRLRQSIAEKKGVSAEEVSDEEFAIEFDALDYKGLAMVTCYVNDDGTINSIGASHPARVLDLREIEGSEPLVEVCKTFAAPEEDLPEMSKIQ